MQPCTLALIAAAVAVTAVLIMYAGRSGVKRERFVSPQARQVYAGARPLLERADGHPTYSEYRAHVPSADPVQYEEVKALWKKGAFTPEQVESVL